MNPIRSHVGLRKATVIAVNDDGSYKVLPDSGRGEVDPIDGVRPTEDTIVLEAGDRVLINTERVGEHPYIVVTTGASIETDLIGIIFDSVGD